MGFNKKTIDKWVRVVEDNLDIKNPTIKYFCCHYCEWLSVNNDPMLADKLLDLKTKLFELPQYKKVIKSECINVLTGRKEYLLEDGTFYDPSYINTHIIPEDLVSLFGIDFLTTIDVSISREFKIDQLLKNGGNN